MGYSEKQIVDVLIESFLREHKLNDRKGVYAKTQKMMAYNSNKIEGSTLTSEQTASLFDTGTLLGADGEIYRAKDIEEMNGHFAMFNYAIHTLDEPLSENIIKQLHYNLKTGVFEDKANGYPIGEYKNRYNIVSDIETAKPGDVSGRVAELLEWYHGDDRTGIYKQMEFHAKFEKIHPFQDGNGRVGRMILFRECLRDKIVPVIIKDETKLEYYHVLHEAHDNGDYNPLYKYGKLQQNYYKEEIFPFLEFDLAESVK